MTRYPLNVSWVEQVVFIIGPAVLIAIALLDLVGILEFESAPRIIMLLPLAMGVSFLDAQLGSPNVIIWHGGPNTIEFKSILRTIRLTPEEIQSIGPGSSSGIGYLEVRSQKRRFSIRNQFDGMHQFLTRLESANPNVQLRGC